MYLLSSTPDAYICCAFGNPGAGKSAYMLQQSLHSANKFKKRIASNIRLNPRAILAYAKKYKLLWLVNQINLYLDKKWSFSCFFYFYDSVLDLLFQDKSIIFLDELGINMFARSYREADRKLILERIFKVRHYGNFLYMTAQKIIQLDSQLEELLNCAIEITGFSPWDNKNNRGSLLFREIFCFTRDEYLIYTTTKKLKPLWKHWVCRGRFDFQFKEKSWSYVFACYPSFNPLEKFSARPVSHLRTSDIYQSRYYGLITYQYIKSFYLPILYYYKNIYSSLLLIYPELSNESSSIAYLQKYLKPEPVPEPVLELTSYGSTTSS